MLKPKKKKKHVKNVFENKRTKQRFFVQFVQKSPPRLVLFFIVNLFRIHGLIFSVFFVVLPCLFLP